MGARGAQEKRLCAGRSASLRGKASVRSEGRARGVNRGWGWKQYSPGGENTVIPKGIFLETQCHWRVLIPETSTKAGKSAA